MGVQGTWTDVVRACLVGLLVSVLSPAPLEGQSGMLAPERIGSLEPAARGAWSRYLEASLRFAELDRAAMAAELAATGTNAPVPAPRGAPLAAELRFDDAWYRSPQGRHVADVVLSFQTPAGGWSKHVDMRTRPRRSGESWSESTGWTYIDTIDNDATTDQIRFLARAARATGGPRYAEGLRRGLEYLFHAQFPHGCWPQVYPLQGGYHDAITHNDDAIALVLELMRDVVDGIVHVPAALREPAAASLERGIDCVLATQVEVDGRKTVWAAQHDPITLVPVQGRSYEHPSLSGGESVRLLRFLMAIPEPGERVIRAVHDAADWFRENAIYGYEYAPKGRLVESPGAGPIWARFYEVGTNRPIFGNRDGAVLYDWHQIEPERRDGYAWYRQDAREALQEFAAWAQRFPAPQ
jgi:PelA/Pel-15E family pectate lyase